MEEKKTLNFVFRTFIKFFNNLFREKRFFFNAKKSAQEISEEYYMLHEMDE